MSIDNPQLEMSSESATPGELLSQERTRQGVSVATVAQALKITESYVRALEANDFSSLPELAFIRGYLRNYARLLGLKPEDIVVLFDKFVGENGAEAPCLKAGSDEPLKRNSHFSPVGLGLTLAAVMLVGGLTYFGWNAYRSDVSQESVSSAGVSVESPASVVADQTEIQESVNPELLTRDFVPAAESDEFEVSPGQNSDPEPTDIAPETQPPLSEKEPVIAVTQNKSVQDEVAKTAVEKTAVEKTAVEKTGVAVQKTISDPVNGQVRLSVRFSEDCWIEVRDASGRIIVSDLKVAGAELNVNIMAPVKIRLGNTQGVSAMTFDGKPVEISPGKRVASLVLESTKQG